ncbi:hypothetical protein KA005_44540 [bacterium]|nr:hypothetical protein [bacterium]
MEGREYKWQIDLRVEDQMFHIRTDNVDDIKTMTGLQAVNCESIARYLADLGKKVKEGKMGTPPANGIPAPVTVSATTHPTYLGLPMCCNAPSLIEKSGTSAKGPWTAVKCENCKQINFRDRKNGSFTGWKPPTRK